MFSTRKLNVISEKKIISKILDEILEKNRIFAYSYFVIDDQTMVDIAGKSA